MRHLPGRGIRRPDHRPDAPGGHREITAGGPRPHATFPTDFQPTFSQLSTKAREPSEGLPGELPVNWLNWLNCPKHPKIGIKRRF